MSFEHGHAEGAVRVIVFGGHTPGWNALLGRSAPVWGKLPQVAEVIENFEADPALVPSDTAMKTVLLPIMERHITACPRNLHHGLFPTAEAVAVLANKANFAGFARCHGLSQHCPTTYATVAETTWPCVLKRLDLNAGTGVAIVPSAAHLAELLAGAPWKGHPYLLQAYEPGRFNYVTHAICAEGLIVSAVTYRQTLPEGQAIRTARSVKSEPFQLSEEHLGTFGRFLLPLRYNGPCSIDFTIAEDGELRVFEINPRLGGSLLSPSKVDDFASMLTVLIRLARPPREAEGRLLRAS